MRAASLGKYALRVLVVWIIEALALLLLERWLPGLTTTSLRAAAGGIAVIGLLNALVRPLLLLVTFPFTLLTFGLLTLALNAMIVLAAARQVPGLVVADWQTGIIITVVLTVVGALLSELLAIHDEDSFYRNVVEFIARRWTTAEEKAHPGLIVLEVDGLSAPIFEQAVEAGMLPTLGGWRASGSHRLARWDCGVPSQTSSSQAGILYGENFDIPAFRWYDKGEGRLRVSNRPTDAAWIEQQVADGGGLLRDNGSSLGNMFSGAANKCALTMSQILSPADTMRNYSAYLFGYFLSPYTFIRTLSTMMWEILVEYYEALRQRMQDVQPRVARGGTFPLLRAMSTVLLRDLGIYMLIEDIMAGIRVNYSTFVGYDVVAHHAGIDRPDAMRVLKALDRQFAQLVRAAERAPREYYFVALSDHGQSQGATFEQRYECTLDALVLELMEGEPLVGQAFQADESWGYLNVFLTEAIRLGGVAGRTTGRVLDPRRRDGYVELGPRPTPVGDDEVVVCASGNLALIYLLDHPARMTMEEIALAHPRLLQGLATHPGIGFVLVHSEQFGAVVVGPRGIHHLEGGHIEGDDPLAPFGPRAADHLRRLDSFPHVGDLVINSLFDPESGEVAAFEHLVGSHGGLGGMQTEPFLLYPAHLPAPEEPLVGAPAIYAQLQRWLDHLQQSPVESVPAD